MRRRDRLGLVEGCVIQNSRYRVKPRMACKKTACGGLVSTGLAGRQFVALFDSIASNAATLGGRKGASDGLVPSGVGTHRRPQLLQAAIRSRSTISASLLNGRGLAWTKR